MSSTTSKNGSSNSSNGKSKSSATELKSGSTPSVASTGGSGTKRSRDSEPDGQKSPTNDQDDDIVARRKKRLATWKEQQLKKSLMTSLGPAAQHSRAAAELAARQKAAGFASATSTQTSFKLFKPTSAMAASVGKMGGAAGTGMGDGEAGSSSSGANKPSKPDEDEVDPLDAFMETVHSEVKDLDDESAALTGVDSMGTGKSGSTGKKGGGGGGGGSAAANSAAAKGNLDYDAASHAPLETDDLMEDLAERDIAELLDGDDTLGAAGGGSRIRGEFVENRSMYSKKELVDVNHANVEYEPFRRSFYIEPPEVQRMTAEQVKAYRKHQLEGVRVRGKNCPKPMLKFAHAGLPEKTLRAMDRLGFHKPTPIQAQAIPAAMSGRDVMGIAKTGSGKTLAFLLPMMRHVADQRALAGGTENGPIGLVMAPTRELALQTADAAKQLAKTMSCRNAGQRPLHVVAVYGGTPMVPQIARLKRGAEIVVCTPGRFIDLLAINNGRLVSLKRVTMVVLDEADRMFDLGFAPQIDKIVRNTRPDRQVLLFSATFPRTVEALARKTLQKPLEITVGGRSKVSNMIEQHVEVLAEAARWPRLLTLVRPRVANGDRVLVFVDRQDSAAALTLRLTSARMPAACLHGGLEQDERGFVLDDFRRGVSQILVATSVAARGLDVSGLTMVVNYDVPNHMEDYVHRVGRTGRAGHAGVAYTFIQPSEEQFAPDLVKALKLADVDVPPNLAALEQAYINKQKQGQLVLTHGSGFGGKGYKFDAAEAKQMRDKKMRERKQYAAMAGDELGDVVVGDDDDDDDADADGDDDNDTGDGGKKPRSAEDEVRDALAVVQQAKGLAGASAGSGGGGSSSTATGSTVSIPKPKSAAPPSAGASAASALNARLNAVSAAASATANSSTGSGAGAADGGGPSLAQAEAAKKAALFALALNRQKQESEASELAHSVNSGPTTLELEINDYPQQSRWKVTQKAAVQELTERFHVALTTRGSYIPSNREPALGERKLYLLIEAPNGAAAQACKAEILRIMEETAMKIRPDEKPRGRYKVV